LELGIAMMLDRVDRRILSVLAEDGRTTCSELAQKVGLSNTPVLRRVRLLEQRGLIAGYAARLDETKLGYSVSVFVSVVLNSQSHEALASFEERVSEMPEVMSCFVMSGSTDYLLRVVVPDLETFRVFVTERLAAAPGLSRLNSSFVLKTVLQRNAPPLLRT
jgi:Lrp/AsnC family leucine-responsive transcriptional regulator